MLDPSCRRANLFLIMLRLPNLGAAKSLGFTLSAHSHSLGAYPLVTSHFHQIRWKTFRKTPTKQFVHKLKLNAISPTPPSTATDTKFFTIENGMKMYKSVSPGSTHRKHPTKSHLHKGSAVWRLSFGKRSTGGRGNTGTLN
jgi:hypothetical protein